MAVESLRAKTLSEVIVCVAKFACKLSEDNSLKVLDANLRGEVESFTARKLAELLFFESFCCENLAAGGV